MQYHRSTGARTPRIPDTRMTDIDVATRATVPSEASPTACIACGTAAPPVRLFSRNGCAISRCAGCGVGSAATRDFDADAYYDGRYFEGGHADGYADYPGSEAILRREFRRVVELLRGHVPDGARLL